jgi:penicillin-binding protein 1C
MKSILFFFIILSIHSNDIPDFEYVKKNYQSSDIKILDRKGEYLNQIRVRKDFRKLDWVELEKLPNVLVKALLIAEDKRFYEHSGVDWYALVDGFFRYISFRSKRGASTISMQVSSFLYEELKPLRGGRSIQQKWNQIQIALDLEKKWKKEEILEAYFNLAPFRSELIGIDSASRAILKKLPHGINSKEASILVSFFKSPQGTEDRIYKRSCFIYKKLDEDSNCDDLKNIIYTIYRTSYGIKKAESLASHISEYLKSETVQSVTTTIDKKIQSFAEDTLNKQMLILKNKNVKDASVLVLSNDTGEILAYVGSSKLTSFSSEVDGVLAKRQAGSTLKPFVYALAIEKKLISESTIINDNPIEIQVGNGIYSPSNYQNKFNGDVTARIALASSLNVPAVKVFTMLDPEEFNLKLTGLGFDSIQNSDFYGPSIALGAIDISLKELTNAYRTLANNGLYSEISFLNKEKGEERIIFDKKTTEIISDILSDKEARSLTFGLENSLNTSFKTSVKTGTSKDMRDNWCIGYNSKYTVGVWVGNFSGEPMWNVSGVTGAAPIWRRIIQYLSNEETEKKISITKEKKLDLVKEKKIPKIISPVSDSIYAIDPDRPLEIQAIFLESNIRSKTNFWKLNGEKVGDTSDIVFWQMRKGKFKLQLIENQRVLEEINFEVR